MKRYCPSCGAGTDYSAVKPAFCSKCGKQYEATVAVAKIPSTRPVVEVNLAPEPEEGEEPRDTEFDVTSLTGLKFSIRGHTGRKVTIGDVAFTSPTDPELRRPIPQSVDHAQIIADMIPNRKHSSATTKPKTKQKTTRKKRG